MKNWVTNTSFIDSIALVMAGCIVYLTLVIASGNGPELLTSLKLESKPIKVVFAVLLLNYALSYLGNIGHGIMVLILFSAFLKLAPDALENVSTLIDESLTTTK